jgi:hypothetical protein
LSTDVSEVRAASIIPDEAARTSETSGDNYFTLRYIPEDNSELQQKYKLISKPPRSSYANLNTEEDLPTDKDVT